MMMLDLKKKQWRIRDQKYLRRTYITMKKESRYEQTTFVCFCHRKKYHYIN